MFICLAGGASAQVSGYFSEFDDGNVIREVGKAVVEQDCRIGWDAFVALVGEKAEATGFTIDGSTEDYAGVLVGNLKLRNEVALDEGTKELIFSNTGVCG